MTDYNGPFDIIGKVAVPAALAVGTGVAALVNDKNIQRSAGNIANNLGNGISSAVNGVGARLNDLGKVSGGIVKGLSSEFGHGAGNSSYYTSRAGSAGRVNSSAIPLQKPVVMSNPGIAMPRGGTSTGTPAHTATARGGTLTTPAHSGSVKAGTMTTPAYTPGISGVTDLPEADTKTSSLANTRAIANTDAAVAEATLPRLPKEGSSKPSKFPDLGSGPDIGQLTINQESADIGRASNFSRGVNG